MGSSDPLRNFFLEQFVIKFCMISYLNSSKTQFLKLQHLISSDLSLFHQIFNQSVMASSHTMSPSKSSFKSRRLESTVKVSVFRSIAASRVDRNTYIQPPPFSRMPDMSSGLFNGNGGDSIIEQFRLHREACDLSIDEMIDDEESRRRILYIREQKLEAISYAIII